MRRKTLVAAFAGAIVLVPFLAACGGDDEEANGEPAAASQTIEISGTEYQFDPSTVSVDSPGTYTFRLVNDGEEPHALEIEGNGIEEETDTIGSGRIGRGDGRALGGRRLRDVLPSRRSPRAGHGGHPHRQRRLGRLYSP